MTMTRSKSKAMKIVIDDLDVSSDTTSQFEDDISEVISENSSDSDSDSDESMDQNFDPDTDTFLDLVDTIYTGEFFESTLSANALCVKDTSSLKPNKNIKELNNQLVRLRENYCKNNINIVDILQMDLSDDIKHKIFESLYQLENTEIFSPEYMHHLDIIKTSIKSTQYSPLEIDIKTKLNQQHDVSYKESILSSEMSFNNKVIAYAKYNTMMSYKKDPAEYAKYKQWLDCVLNIPFGVYRNTLIDTSHPKEDIQAYFTNVRGILDRRLSFLESPKDQIINILAQNIRNKKAGINAIGLYSNPGCGKTDLVKSIAEALDRPYKMISLGGESDVSNLTGSNFTYIGSHAGKIINMLTESGCMNPVCLIDEIDKIADTPHGNEIIASLIHLTDTTTNKMYNCDKYLAGIEVDLSQVLFIFTYNDHTKINKVLADRMLKIHIPDYTHLQKLEITKKHLLPNILVKIPININMSDECLEYIIKKCNGLREIKANLEIIISRINTLMLSGGGIIKLKYNELYNYFSQNNILKIEHINLLLQDTTNTKRDDPPFGMYI
jgi:ATP-dependent Lon protease